MTIEAERSFRQRFGDEIPDNILNLLFKEEKVKTVINHKVGRELIYDVIRELSIAISKELTGKPDNASTDSFKRFLFEITEIILPLLDNLNLEYEKDVLSQDEKAILLKKLGRDGFAEVAKKMNILDQFYFAYNTKPGKAVKDYLISNIDKFVEQVYMGEVFSPSDYYKYSSLADKWKVKINLRNDSLKKSRKIIYGGNYVRN